MKWIEEVIDHLDQQTGLSRVLSGLEDALAQPGDLEMLKDLLGASSILLHAGSATGELLLPPLGKALEATESLHGPDAHTAVLGVGNLGRAVLMKLAARRRPGAFPRALYLDLESSRSPDLPTGTAALLLDGAVEGDPANLPRFGELLKAAYHAAAGSNLPPALLMDHLSSASGVRLTVHVAIGAQDPWMFVLPDLLLDLRNFLGRGARGRVVLHLLTRPGPRLRQGVLAVLQDLERTRPFEDAFVVCVDEVALPQVMVDFVLRCAQVPEILLNHGAGARGGAFGSYGQAAVPEPGEEDAGETYLRRLEIAYNSAAPYWTPGNSILLELTEERVIYLHPASHPPPAEAWRLHSNLSPQAIDEPESCLCRIQRGLRLADLRLG